VNLDKSLEIGARHFDRLEISIANFGAAFVDVDRGDEETVRKLIARHEMVGRWRLKNPLGNRLLIGREHGQRMVKRDALSYT
jgi:hypothetical protein